MENLFANLSGYILGVFFVFKILVNFVSQNVFKTRLIEITLGNRFDVLGERFNEKLN